MTDHLDWSVSAHVGKFTITSQDGNDQAAVELAEGINRLTARATTLVDLLWDAEINHGSLVGTKTLRARDELKLELARWK